MTARRIGMAWAAAAVVVAAGATPAWADNCWTDATAHGCDSGNGGGVSV